MIRRRKQLTRLSSRARPSLDKALRTTSSELRKKYLFFRKLPVRRPWRGRTAVLQTYGTFTARNVIGEQHESREQVYNVKSPVVLSYQRTLCYVMNSYAMQNSITNSSGMHKHGYPRCKIQSSPATQSHNQFCHAKSRIVDT